MIKFECCNCGQPIEIISGEEGQSFECPSCKNELTVPNQQWFPPTVSNYRDNPQVSAKRTLADIPHIVPSSKRGWFSPFSETISCFHCVKGNPNLYWKMETILFIIVLNVAVILNIHWAIQAYFSFGIFKIFDSINIPRIILIIYFSKI